MAKPALILVGADKGGVGKTTVARTLLDYFTAHQVATRAFDTEMPKGTLKRFHREVSEVVDATVDHRRKCHSGRCSCRLTVADAARLA
jgi:MinD superfamily P-loop ATPase